MTTFQSIVLMIFGVLAVAGVAFFALTSSSSRDNYLGEAVMWGTLPAEQMQPLVDDINNANSEKTSFKYVEIVPEFFEQKLVEAIADGKGPDLVLLPDEYLYRQKGKVAPFSLEIISARTFRDIFTERGEIFLGNDGAFALPLGIDPLVLYWNRDIISTAGLSRVPSTWEEVAGNTAALTKRDERGNIIQSAISLGGTRNIANTKAIISALLLQVGDSITNVGADGSLYSALGTTQPGGEPSLSALRFYGEFGNPGKMIYTWNSALPEARALFARGQLALYIGFASELALLRAENPNLNIDAAPLPHSEGTRPLTYGKSYGIALLKSSANPSAGQLVAFAFMDDALGRKFMLATGIPSAKRSVLAERNDNPILATFVKSALVSRGWVDPNPAKTSEIFTNMIERTKTGVLAPDRAIFEAGKELGAVIGEE